MSYAERSLGQELVDEALRIVVETSEQYQALMPTGAQHPPLPFFGSLEQARVITFGLNPSAGEFSAGRGWPVSMAAAALAERMENYFVAEHPSPHPWFRPWSTVLSMLGTSYSSDAAHVDLSPRATKAASQFRSEPLRSLFVSMLVTDAKIWIEALRRAPSCSLVIAAGSATNDSSGYINEFIRDRLPQTGVRLLGPWRRQRGAGQTASHRIGLPGGREIPLFFCSTGPTMNGGATLVSACRANLDVLKQFLNA